MYNQFILLYINGTLFVITKYIASWQHIIGSQLNTWGCLGIFYHEVVVLVFCIYIHLMSTDHLGDKWLSSLCMSIIIIFNDTDVAKFVLTYKHMWDSRFHTVGNINIYLKVSSQ